MKIATFNVNNINRRLPHLLAWLKKARPDIACLQELKCETSAFPEAALRRAGYGAAWVGERSWNGVAILARKTELIVTRRPCRATRGITRPAISKPLSTV